MFQKFYVDTLGGRYIKSLLSQIKLPNVTSVKNNVHLIEGFLYVYKRYIIKCVSSGILYVSEQENLIPSETLYPSVFLFPGSGYKAATFKVLCYLEMCDPRLLTSHVSTENFYDSETHKYLGNYLRYIHTTQGINLFPYYNSYNGKYLYNTTLSVYNHHVVINNDEDKRYKVLAVPILFGKTYSIFIDCSSQVLIRGCIHDDTKFINETALPDSLKTVLEYSGRIITSMRFDSPVEFRLEISDIKSMMYQKDLYLLIQLPSNNDSSIVVLENYSVSKNKEEGITNYLEDPDKNSISKTLKTSEKTTVVNPSLLWMNTRETYAFSDRLFEYIIGNTIDKRETNSYNIERIQKIICEIDSSYRYKIANNKRILGVWDEDLSKIILSQIDNQKEKQLTFDQDGYVNKDVELLLSSLRSRI